MALHKCEYINCAHKFFWLSVDCREEDKVYCPLCQSGVDISDMELPQEKKWSECKKKSCQDCKKN